MFTKSIGDSAVEWIVVAAVVLAVVGTIVWTITQSAKTQGGNVSSWITGINVPTTP